MYARCYGSEISRILVEKDNEMSLQSFSMLHLASEAINYKEYSNPKFNFRVYRKFPLSLRQISLGGVGAILQ